MVGGRARDKTRTVDQSNDMQSATPEANVEQLPPRSLRCATRFGSLERDKCTDSRGGGEETRGPFSKPADA